jgi:hypothetical protein
MRLTDAELAEALREERPSIDAEFAAMLDERAAGGFKRERSLPALEVFDRLRTVPPRLILAPAGAVATILVVVGVSMSTLGGEGAPTGSESASTTVVSQASPPAAGSGSGGAVASPAGESTLAAPARPGIAADAGKSLAPAAPGLGARKVASTASMTLSTDPDQVREVAGQVTDIMGRYRGLVISSQITSGQGGPPQPIPLEEAVPVNPSLGAEFQLRVPASKLEQALDDLSGLGLVVSRTEGSQDITGRFNSTRERIANLTSERDVLIEQLARATSPIAVHAIRHRLAVVRHELSAAQGQLGQLHERVAMVPVHLSVVASGSGAGGGGGFGLDDATHDAGRVLTVAAGVLLISLAVLAPIALIGGLAWLLGRSFARWRRERALEV